jgi:hypothetical protein
VGVRLTTYGAASLQAIIGKLKMLPPDQPNRIIAAGSPEKLYRRRREAETLARLFQ